MILSPARRASRNRSATRRAVATALAVLPAGVMIAACGGSGSPVAGVGAGTTESPTASNSPVGMSRCMRGHGVAAFPDPSRGPGGSLGLTITMTPGSTALTVDGVSFSGPAFEAAEKACQRFFPSGGGGPQLSATQRAAALRLARCMRANGVPGFRDPTFSKNGGGLILRGGGPGPNPQSPAFQKARAACGRP